MLLLGFESIWDECKSKVIDCTQAGPPKNHVDESMPLAEALDKYGGNKVVRQAQSAPDVVVTPAHVIGALWAVASELGALRNYIRRMEKVYQAAEELDDWENPPAWIKSDLKYYSALIDNFQRAKKLTEWYSGRSDYVKTWMGEQIELDDPKDKALYQRKIERDLAYMREMSSAAGAMQKSLKKTIKILKRKLKGAK